MKHHALIDERAVLIVSQCCVPFKGSSRLFAMSAACEAPPTGLTTFIISEQEFCILRSPKGLVHASASITPPRGSRASFQLATVITWNKKRFTNDDLDQIELDFTARDDVWNASFLEGKIPSTIAAAIGENSCLFIAIILRSSITPTVEFEREASVYIEWTATDLPDGPYVVYSSTGDIFPVCRLFEDKYHAFIGGSVGYDSITKSFDWLNIEVSPGH